MVQQRSINRLTRMSSRSMILYNYWQIDPLEEPNKFRRAMVLIRQNSVHPELFLAFG